MQLNHVTLKNIRAKDGLSIPDIDRVLPEKVLQFGTGVLLRGLPDHFIDQANKAGLFNGRIVVVKSTPGKPPKDFEDQDHLYTLCIKGLEDGRQVEEYSINSSVSRVLSASENWPAVLECAADPNIEIIISNTTEVGIKLETNDRITGPEAPASFPAKLTAFLYRRFAAFHGASDAGMVILPTELLPDNGTTLRSICIRLAEINNLGAGFVRWLAEANDFCNTLVDCIVPGALPAAEAQKAAAVLGYEDNLMIMSEVYRLWAIETVNPESIERLSFAAVNPGVVIAPNIDKFRDLKLRLLNGAHTFSCGLALLSGFDTVREAMNDQDFARYISELMEQEIVPTLTGADISEEQAQRFAHAVLDRFRNPHIEHRWQNIAQQYSSKMMMRNIPTLQRYYNRFNRVPAGMAKGFAAYLYFMRPQKDEPGGFYSAATGRNIPLDDQHAALLYAHWNNREAETAAMSILSDTSLWKKNLLQLPGFADAVLNEIKRLQERSQNTPARVEM
ncbi:tagaturonate reductase [Pedobacter sp. SYP-B3415]|uniref:tagaturonate reductase n=1 Tax=Pedobacter sp. SYP-B3415 TaxID=2496641 RepID=UPI00101C92E1|nr:tagaturonate reductase [Pedobacter sp. SYP-B3415]